MTTILGHDHFKIMPICTFLNGAKECRFKIELEEM